MGSQKGLLLVMVDWLILKQPSQQTTMTNFGQNIYKKLSEGTGKQMT